MNTVGSAKRAEAESYGAIAFSDSKRRCGYAWGAGSLPEAEALALKYCQTRDARIVLRARNSHLAVARGDDDSFGWAAHEDPVTASNQAVAACPGPNPKIVALFHSFGGASRMPG
jgi:hypothetical protein